MTPFQQAFADARKAGKKEFEFGGKPYHTRLKGEKVAADSSPRPKARTVKATVQQTVRPGAPVVTKGVTTVTGTPVRRGGADTRPKAPHVPIRAAGVDKTKVAKTKFKTRTDYGIAGIKPKK